MSDLPLQPAPDAWPPRWRRVAAVLALALAVLLAGALAPGRNLPAQAVLGGPGAELGYAREARRLIDGAQRSLWMAMYVVRPDDGPVLELMEALAAAQARGVDVRVVLDAGGDWDGQPDLKHEAPAVWLRARGIHVVLDEAGVTTHAKVMVADGRRILGGSHNWTRRALTTNRELSWRIDDPGAAATIGAWLGAIPGFAR